jgi:hypothetical protein
MGFPMSDIRRLSKYGFIRLLVLWVRGTPYFWLKVFLSGYAYAWLAAVGYIGTVHRGKNEWVGWSWIPRACLVLIEVQNQATFYLAKRNRDKTSHLKAPIFWILFTIGCVTDTAIRLHAETTGSWVLMDHWSALIVLFLLSAILPWYSFSPDIRFFVLHGQFEHGRKEPKGRVRPGTP